MAVAPLAIAAATACGSGAPDARYPLRSDSGGVEIVINSDRDQVLRWRTERGWSTGGADGDRLLLSRLFPEWVAADSAGHVYVLDADGKRVIVLSDAAVPVDTIGREGGGPGELEEPFALAVAASGAIAVYDLGKGAFVRWSADREPLALNRVELMPWSLRTALTPDGLHLIQRGRRAEGGSEYRLVRWRGGPQDTLARVERSVRRVVDFPSCNARRITVEPLLAPEIVWYEADGHIAVQAGSTYAIDVYEGGRWVKSLRRAIAPRPVTEAIARRAAQGWTLNDCTVPPNEVVHAAGYAEVLPALSSLALSRTGEVWARRNPIEDRPPPIDVFAPDGSYRGTLPRGFPFPVAFLPADRIVAIETDSLDVPSVTVYRVIRSS